MVTRDEHDRLELDGGVLAYRSFGAGPVIVFTHAFGAAAWGDLAWLAERCTVVIVDWDATTLDRKSHVSFAWFEPLVRAHGRERGTLCAWSMSGAGAVWFAGEEPPALERLILVDIAGLCDVEVSWRLRDLWHLFAMRVLGRPTRGFVRMLWRGWVHREGVVTRELEDVALAFFSKNAGPIGFDGEGDEDEDEQPLIEDLRDVAVPCLVVVGRHSKVLGPEHGREAVERLPKGELVVFEESAHSPQLEEPDEFQRAVAAFVLGVDDTEPRPNGS